MAEERKLVTILFADVAGSTALGDEMDPEDLRALMSRYYEHAHRIVAEHGGTLEKFIGDAVMAVFGLPQAHGNDVERALAAALALRSTIAGDSVLSDRLLVRLGVNTGEVAASSDTARGEFLVTGDAVNLAARLEQTAAPGEILTSERTQAAAKAAMIFGEPRRIEVKGKREPVHVYPLVGSRPRRQLGRPPLVGRKQDLAQLALLRDRVLEERRPQLVSILAPAGTGKTRLLEEFLARLDAAEGWKVATARCLPYGHALTYWPLRGLLEELLGEPATQMTVDRVVTSLTQGVRADKEARELGGAILSTLGVDLEETAERDLIFPAWRMLLEALAREAPRTVVFEDLHWASESLLDLVEHLMQPRTQAALLIIAISRPELLDRRPAWGGGRRNYTALALEPLSEQQTAQLVEALATGLPATATQQIVERSGGNPFFAIELTRAAAERDGHRPNGGVIGSSLPDTVHEAVLARLDQLAPPERHVLQAASVAGRTFHAATLQALMAEPLPGGIATALDDLLARDLIAPAESEADAYAFRHILIRDVAYGTLARSERIRLHAAVATWLEQFAAGRLDEYAELIAYHYYEAVKLARQSAVPIPLPFDVAVAVRALERAGEVASRIGAVLEARRHLEAAIDLAPAEEHLRLYEELGDCAAYGDAAIDAYSAALERWRAQAGTRDPLTGARLLRKQLIIRTRWQGSLAGRLSQEEMEALRQEARHLADAAGDEDERWRVSVVNLFWPFWLGALTPEAEEEGRLVGPEAVAYFEGHSDWGATSEALDGYGSVLLEAGDFGALAEVSRRRLVLQGLPHLERGDACAMLAQALCEAGDYASSIGVAQQTMASFGSGLSPTFVGNTVGFGALAACLSGRWGELDELTRKLEEAWDALGRDAGARYLWRGFAAALHVAKAHEERPAIDRAAAALQRLTLGQQGELRNPLLQARDPLLAAYANDDVHALDKPARFDRLPDVVALGVMFACERGAQLDASYLRGIVEDRGGRPLMDALARCVVIAEALAASDDARLAAAIEEAEAGGLIPHAARMRIVLAQRTGDRAPLERARPVLERLGDRQFLRRLEEVAATLG